MRTIIETVATYNTENGTYQQQRVLPLYEFYELDAKAKDRVLHAFMDELESDPYRYEWFNESCEAEIWECVRDLEASIHNARVEWSYNRWYSCDFDVEYKYSNDCDPGYIEQADNNGVCYSFDLCDVWNSHVRKLNAIYYKFDYLDYLCWDVYNDFDSYTYEENPHNRTFYQRADAMRDQAIAQWYEELENACDDVRYMIETLLRGEWEYFTSEEYAMLECEDESTQGGECYTCDYAYYKNGGYTGKRYYSDNRKWYTADGEFSEQSNVHNECVSIVRAS